MPRALPFGLLMTALVVAWPVREAMAGPLDGLATCQDGMSQEGTSRETVLPGCDRLLQAATNDSLRLTARLLRGHAYLKLRDTAKALEDYEAALALEPSDPAVRGYRAVALGRLGRHEDAIEALGAALAARPGDVVLLTARAAEYLAVGRTEPALADLDKALGARPRYSKALAVRAAAERAEGRLDAAAADADKAVEVNAKEVEARIVRASLRLAARPDDALADLAAAIAAEPLDPAPLNARGVVEARRGRLERALSDFDAAIAIAGAAYAAPHYNRGVVNERLGRQDIALADYGAAIAADPGLLAAHAARGLLHDRRGETDAALVDLLAADRIFPADDISRKAKNQVADALARIGHPRGAPGRYSFYGQYNVGLELVGPLPEGGDIIRKRNSAPD